ncbi:MAG: hypothetical protein QW041_01675 [Candidatus Pacearchaeota archaeon]
MQTEYFKLLKELVVQVAGKNTEAVIDILKDGKPINEFKIADRLKMTINQARNILYKLYNQNIVSFVRKKDEKKGWYIYSWSLNVPKALERLKILKEKELNNLNYQLNSRENKRFYNCPNKCTEFNEESAMLHHFTCPECGTVLQLESSEELTKDLKNKIVKTKQEIIDIDNELKKIESIRLMKLEAERLAKKKKRLIAIKRARKKNKKKIKKLRKSRLKSKK